MVRVLLIVAPVMCAACGGPAPTPVAPLGATDQAVPDALFDMGTFVVVDKEKVDPTSEENFEIWKTAAGYRMTIQWKRTLPTGEAASGTIRLTTDDRFVPVAGDDEMSLGKDISKSTIRREPDGRFTTEQTSAAGEKQTHSSAARNDWFVGEMFTSFLNVMCHADESLTAPTVYPDKQTTLEPARPMPIDGSSRPLTYRKLTYTVSKNLVIAACEDGKLAGEVTRGTTIVRRGDLALARELERRFR